MRHGEKESLCVDTGRHKQSMELIIWQNYLNLNCVNLNYWQVSFNKTEYYVAFNIALNLIILTWIMNIWNLTQVNFLWQFFYIDMYFQNIQNIKFNI